MRGHIAYYLLRQYLVYIYTSTNRVLGAPLSTQCSQVSITFQTSSTWRVIQLMVAAQYRRHCISTEASHVRVRCGLCVFSYIFSVFAV